MIVELTLICTFIAHHFMLGLGLGGLIWSIGKLPLHITSEAQSRLWLVSYILITVLPFMVFIVPPATQQANKFTALTSETNNQILPIEVLQTGLPASDNALVYWHVPQEFVYNISSLLLLLLAMWALGIIWRLAGLAYRLNNTKQLSEQLKVKRTIALSNTRETITFWLSSQTSSPLVIGLLSPKIVIPESLFQQLTNQQLQHVVLHEQAHIQRRDLITTAIQELIAITFWWSPVMRPLNKQIYLARELACDIRAAHKSANNLTYAQTLLDCAKLMFQQKKNILAMSLFSKQKDLTIRINGVIAMHSSRVFSNGASLLSCALLVLFSLYFTHTFSPKINLPQIKLDAKLWLRQSPQDSKLMIDAVASNRLSVIKQLLARGVDIDVAALGDGTALIMAVRANNMAMVQGLLALGANPDQSSQGDGNPLIVASKSGNIAMLKTLLAAGAKINNQVKYDETPLINASHKGNLAVVQFLVEHGANVNLTVAASTLNGIKLRSPLNRASNNDIRQYLLSRGAIK